MLSKLVYTLKATVRWQRTSSVFSMNITKHAAAEAMHAVYDIWHQVSIDSIYNTNVGLYMYNML